MLTAWLCTISSDWLHIWIYKFCFSSSPTQPHPLPAHITACSHWMSLKQKLSKKISRHFATSPPSAPPYPSPTHPYPSSTLRLPPDSLRVTLKPVSCACFKNPSPDPLAWMSRIWFLQNTNCVLSSSCFLTSKSL